MGFPLGNQRGAAVHFVPAQYTHSRTWALYCKEACIGLTKPETREIAPETCIPYYRAILILVLV